MSDASLSVDAASPAWLRGGVHGSIRVPPQV
jgi:hypothetical protein